MSETKLKPVDTRNEEAISMLEGWLDQARNGELVTVALVGKRIGGDWQTGMSSSDNRLEDAAMLMELAMRRMGFALRGEK